VSRAVGDPRRIDIGDLAYRVWGAAALTGELPTIVLVHGIGVSHRYLARLHEELRRRASGRFAVVSVELPGHAGLPKPRADADVSRIATGLDAALAACGAGPLVLVGHSMGAQWVTELAVRRGGRDVTAVVLMGPVSDEAHRSHGAQAVALAVDTLRERLRTNAIVFADYVRCGVRWYLTQSRHMVAYPIEERVARLELPVLVMRGERDPIAGESWCRRLAAATRRARLAVVPGGAHVVQDAAPEAVADRLLDFAIAAGLPNL